MKILGSALALVLAGSLAVPAPVMAQDAGAMLGSWELLIAESDFGPTSAPDSVLMTIERADDRLIMDRQLFSDLANGRNHVQFDMPIDGSSHPATTSTGTQDFSASWHGSELVMATEVGSNVGQIELIDHLSVEADGQTLVMERQIEVPNTGPIEATLVFVRRD